MQANREKEIYKVTFIGSLVNLGLFIFKLFAGIVGHSSAMVADAFHSLSDFITDIIVFFFIKLSSKPADKEHTYGHGKFETLGTLVIAVVMALVGIGLFYHSAKEIYGVFTGKPIVSPGWIAFIAALISIASKEILFQYTIRKGKKLKSSAVIANAWHHRSDAMSSVCTVIGIGGAILLGGKWAILDPIAAGVVSIFIVEIGVKLIKPCIDELLERSLPLNVEREIVDTIISVPNVERPSNLQTRKIGNNYAIEFNMYVNKGMSLEKVCRLTNRIERTLKKKYGPNTHVGINLKIKRK